MKPRKNLASLRNAKQRHVRVDLQLVRLDGGSEREVGFFAGGDDGAEEDRAALKGSGGVNGHWCDERPRHAFLKQFAANLKPLLTAVRGELQLVVRNTRSADVLVEKPLH